MQFLLRRITSDYDYSKRILEFDLATVFDDLSKATVFVFCALTIEGGKLQCFFTPIVMAGVIGLFLEVTIFGVTIVSKIAGLKEAILEVTFFNLAYAIL